MIVATRFGSKDAAPAHRTMSLPQCWTSFVKMGEIPLEEVVISEAKDQIGVTAPPEFAGAGAAGSKLLIGGAAVWNNMVESFIGSAAGESGDLSAINATKPTISKAASGGRI